MVNVAVIGAGGGIGQPLAMLLKQRLPFGSTLSLYDVAGAEGVAADLSHVDSRVNVRWAQGKIPTVPNCPELRRIAQGVDVFVVVAGVPRKPGMTRDDLFNVNAGICLDIVKTCAPVAPKAIWCIVTNPVNSTIPIAAEALKKLGVYDKNRLFGVSHLDGQRAVQFVNDVRAPFIVPYVPVVGGHSDTTIVPLFSQLPGPALSKEQVEKLTVDVQVAGTVVVKAKAGKGSATLSMACAGASFALSVVDGLLGRSTPLVYSYVDTDGTQDLPFFALPVVLGKNGLEKRLPIGPVSAHEQKVLAAAKPEIKKNIEAGVKFAKSKL